MWVILLQVKIREQLQERGKIQTMAAGRVCSMLLAARNTVVAAADLRICKKFMASHL